ncbi:creatininase family protein [Aurantimonas marina]|uniref:creatininase family protein n=1 Tax=Aurantimonas marina TaxID=2780508 RepID=UPI0019CFDC8F|nr:creatininase family protein [Aurantimonas marina]
MRWERLTTREIQDLPRTMPVIVNVAAIEQHGPHLPLDTDVVIGGAFLDALENQASDEVLILPQVKVCCSEHHMDFSGTLSIGHRSFLDYVGAILQSVVRHGFRNLVIFNSHGGNQAIGQVLLEEFGASHRDCRIAMLTWWRLAGPEIAQIRESAFAGANHACELETSLMLHIDPEAVRQPDHLPAMSYVPTHDWANADMVLPARGALFRSMAEMSDGLGAVGDASLATAAKGQAIIEAVTEQLLAVVRDLSVASSTADLKTEGD